MFCRVIQNDRFFLKMSKVNYKGLKTPKLLCSSTDSLNFHDLFTVLFVQFGPQNHADEAGQTCLIVVLGGTLKYLFQKWRTKIPNINLIWNTWDISGRKH